jgi:hypothetical protein
MRGPDVFRGGLLADRFRVKVGYRTVDRVHCGPGRDQVKLVFVDPRFREVVLKVLNASGARRLSPAKFELPPALRIRPRQRGLVFLKGCEIARLLSR